ncbi:MAG TPA: hypothetical protein PK904_13095 [Bacteroidales bacterium]|nr:hypothetical protein [Bacteroidales bacterium]
MLTNYGYRLLGRILVIGFAVFVWVRPLFFGYHHLLFFDIIQFGLLGISILLFLTISIKLKPFQINRFIVGIIFMIFYPYFHQVLISKSENIFFQLRKGSMNNIVTNIMEDSSYLKSNNLKVKLRLLQIHDVVKGENYIAFRVNGILDNTDGFVYLDHGKLPYSMFDGNLIYKDSIAENWFAFSTR